MSKKNEAAAAKSTKNVKTEAKVEKAKSPVCKPQVRILQVLANLKPGKSINRSGLAEASGVALSWITGFTTHAGKANRTESLAEQGLIKVKKLALDGGASETVFEITASGRKLLEKIAKESKAK